MTALRGSASAAGKNSLLAGNALPRRINSGFLDEARRGTLSGVDAVVNEDTQAHRDLLGRNVKRYRRHAGLSQQQLGLRLDRDRRIVSDWENGRHAPSPTSLRRLAHVLDVPYGAFFDPHTEGELL
jgi:DNA-binding transcriptional regulator YiaG